MNEECWYFKKRGRKDCISFFKEECPHIPLHLCFNTFCSSCRNERTQRIEGLKQQLEQQRIKDGL